MSRLAVLILVGSILWLAGCGGGIAPSNTANDPPAAPADNVATITVGGGPAGLVNGLFTTVTVCSPGSTSNCATVGGILVDTGSYGLRIMSEVLPAGFSLSPQTDSNGHPIAECAVFADGFSWGPMVTADITIAGEKASATGVQIINGNFASIPRACSSGGGTEEDTVATFGANGVLGVGNFAQDCGPACTVNNAYNPGMYYSCPASGCVVTAEPLAQQVTNPVAFFATDNNGVIVQLPAVTSSSGEVSATGSLVFGIGTQANNSLGSATVFTLDADGNFTTTFLGNSLPGSFVDSGSTFLFFPDSNLKACGTGFDSYYCPSSTVNLSATNQGLNGNRTTINFSVANAANLPAQNMVFNDVAAPLPSTLYGFDWGVPFFFGRSVFVAIEGSSTPGGTGPYVAY